MHTRMSACVQIMYIYKYHKICYNHKAQLFIHMLNDAYSCYCETKIS